jgi:rare lipoprotein A
MSTAAESYYGGAARPLEPTRVSGEASMHRATLRGYSVMGKRYYPQIRPLGWSESGIASWYGSEFHGKRTSSGEIYDMYAPGTAAHKTFPMNTIVLVTNRNTGAKVKARINDRGPFVSGRIIDLSYTAGKAIGLDKTGTAPVTIQILEYDAHISAQLGVKAGDRVAEQDVKEPAKTAPKDGDKAAPIKAPQASAGNYWVQLGSFRNYDGAHKVKKEAQAKAGREVSIKSVNMGKEKIHRVLIGGFTTKEEAARFKDSQGFSSAVVVAAS